MTFDKCLNRLILSDHINIRIQVIHLHDETVVKTFGGKGRGESQLMLPDGLCLNKLTGELFLCAKRHSQSKKASFHLNTLIKMSQQK